MKQKKKLRPEFDTEKAETILLAIRTRGVLPEQAAAFARVNATTFNQWLRAPGPPYDEFREQIRHAAALFEMRLADQALGGQTTVTETGKDGKTKTRTIVRDPNPTAAAMLRSRRQRVLSLDYEPPSEREDRRRITRGRPRVWTRGKQRAICAQIAAGNTFRTSCISSGVSWQTATDWFKEGHRESLKPAPDPQNWRYLFYVAVVEAQTVPERRDVATIQDAVKRKVWKAAAWDLEHRPGSREEWARQTNSVSVNVATDVNVRGFEDQILARASELPDAALSEEIARLDRVLELTP